MRKATKAKTTDPTTVLRDRCLSHFTTLRVPVQPAALDELLTRAEKENLSYLSFLDRLLGAEAGARRERAVSRRIREAHFREDKTLEGFDWNFNPKTFNRAQMEELATGDFIRRRTNLVIVGWSGSGKVTSSRRSGREPASMAIACCIGLQRSCWRISPLRSPTRRFLCAYAATPSPIF